MQQQDSALLDLATLAEVICAAAIRSGDLLALDKIAELPVSDRAMHATMVISKSAGADPDIARVLTETKAVHIMRNEIMRRRTNQ
ncbi:hypothetical protein [Paraburkholderia hospita]|uniref:hypothetical protein n=1 Tax=Paraburkholderia hospita TaxID=169430 RepID=UPI0008A75FC7|nr:hypothetical protein [Paraburkholderia hospita]SEI14427.1 hypothetical protein SAMN05192544_102528 [Paraburkholderia hospita]